MIEGIIEWSIRNRFLVILASIVIGIAGFRALMTMPVDAIPDQSENQVIVFTDWMGRSPQEIEDQVTYPLTTKLQGLAGVKVVRSSSEFNFSMINVIFDDSTDYYFARQRVLERLATVAPELPQGVTPYMAPDATAVGQIFWYTVEGENSDLGELRAIQDWYVRYQLNSVPGVAEVASVGGAPREYQIDLDPNRLRSYGISLGEVYSAVQRSNSAVGGRVIHKGNAEYLIRSVGWIKNLEDLKDTVVAQRGGVPIDLRAIASVQLGPGFKRSVLEKDGREVVGGVVMMRFGENPLEVTRKVKEKITTLSAGLPEGVRIVPFYDRTPLINKALETVSATVKEEIIISTVMIVLIMGHLGGAFVVSITLPLAILFSFLLMKIFGIPSNIMSLAGIAISVGILEDQAVVMTENAAHHLTRRFGNRRVTGNVLDVIIPACRTVGRPIFFSVLITIVSFLPVFALTGRSGKMFHPLAWTKTFALIGVAILAITLVPALIPIFLKGRIKSEDDSWLVRTMITIFKPMLSWLMDRTTLVCWLFVCILGTGYLASTRLGSEFMPPLDEGSILDMPTSVPRMSVTQATQDLKARDAVLRGFPEVLMVVGKAGRAETATDPSPLDMVETIINLHDREVWPKRKLKFEDALIQTQAALTALEAKGILKPAATKEERDAFLNEAAMEVVTRVDATLRDLALLRLKEHRIVLGNQLAGEAVESLIERVDPAHIDRRLTAMEREDLAKTLGDLYGERLALETRFDDVTALVKDASRRLIHLGVLREHPDLLSPPPSSWEQAADAVGEVLGKSKETLFTRLTEHLVGFHEEKLKERMKTLNWELFDRAVGAGTWAALEELTTRADAKNLTVRKPEPDELPALRATLEKPFSDRLFLWQKSKQDLVDEMGTALQVPGWGNIFTQPIINRIEMLATGVRTPVGVKVFGDNLDEIQRVSQEIAEVLRGVRGANGVVPDQIVGKGYVEVDIDRKKAARYGIQVGDIQDVVEVAMGGKPLTMTVEGRRRFPVRVRYARDFRTDEEALKNTLVTARGATGATGAEGGDGMGASSPGVPGSGAAAQPVQVPLSEVAAVRVVEGPSMIKSENGLLRAYVQLTVTGRDEVGFVEEARRVVADRVKLPPGMYVEWSGQFENELKTRKTLQLVFPAVIAVIVLILYLTYKSWIDAGLMMTSVLGALAGGAMFQWLFGFNFSVAVWVGYIACFGMATETGIVMLVYLREAIDERGGLEGIGSIAELKEAILDGAIHRLRPKLLTEGTTIISIAPMLWASGVGSEVIRPMAAPVLGGLLIADEVIDIFLPVLYFAVKKWQWRKIHHVGLFDVNGLRTPGTRNHTVTVAE
ncbi:efflux RND transporter permease subunit [Singulisphaera acidiphila]|uniref:Putative silver efflux pump n=1 Tax=Singulisphaera acidiphila (strain ATCC BAA-1392 / DSM 18658 / VKM B-2454 / MOB10) TaxID=886293 RepID=L0DC68_SINAD|nr:efflux RND transporter permease subunit [Singulisphaera acidiphila]AGA26832.1 putative silver efflux pump [Singulisphaera acidiphila DSM 18658]